MIKLAAINHLNELLHGIKCQLNEQKFLNCELVFSDGVIKCHAAMLHACRIWWLNCCTSVMDECSIIQGDQKGRCQKYLLISPKLFEPQKYVIHS